MGNERTRPPMPMYWVGEWVRYKEDEAFMGPSAEEKIGKIQKVEVYTDWDTPWLVMYFLENCQDEVLQEEILCKVTEKEGEEWVARQPDPEIPY